MLSFKKSKEILNSYGHSYTDEETRIIREFVAILLDIDYKLFERKLEQEFLIVKENQAKIIQLNPNYEESNIIHPGEHRRAG
jgi:hypothetical protein